MKPLSRIAALAALCLLVAGCGRSATPTSGPQDPGASARRSPRFYVQDLTLVNKTGVALDMRFTSPNCVSGFPGSLKLDPDEKWDGHLKTVTGQQCITGSGYAKFNLRAVPPGEEDKANLVLLFGVNRRGNWTIDFSADSVRSPLCITGSLTNLELREKKSAPAGCLT
jgi:hypothetical protein